MTVPYPRARDLIITGCADPACRAVHIELLDAEGKIFAGLTVSVDRIDEFVADVQAAADRVRAKATRH